VSFHDSRYHIHPLVFPGVSRFQHGICFSHSCGITEKYFQFPATLLALFGFYSGQKGIWIRSNITIHRSSLPPAAEIARLEGAIRTKLQVIILDGLESFYT
jgi:hypothetical protein